MTAWVVTPSKVPSTEPTSYFRAASLCSSANTSAPREPRCSPGSVVVVRLTTVVGADAVLDATVDCVARYGLAKTSLSDIAREMGVAPSTVYRKVGTVENAVRLVMAREGHRQLARMPELIAGITGPRVITVCLAETIT